MRRVRVPGERVNIARDRIADLGQRHARHLHGGTWTGGTCTCGTSWACAATQRAMNANSRNLRQRRRMEENPQLPTYYSS